MFKLISNLEELEMLRIFRPARTVQKYKQSLNYQSKDDLLTPKIDKVVVLQRLLVGYRDSVTSKGLDSWMVLGILSCPNSLISSKSLFFARDGFSSRFWRVRVVLGAD